MTTRACLVLGVLVELAIAAGCRASAVSPAPSPVSATTSETGATTTAGSVVLDAKLWTEGLAPTYVTFRNDASGALFIDIPGEGRSVNYAYAPSPSRVLSGTLRLTFRVDVVSGQPAFHAWPEAANTCQTPAANVRPFIFANNNDWSGEYSRWWAVSDFTLLAPGSFALDVPLTPERWTSVLGVSGASTPTQFVAALNHVSSLGVSFGAGCFYGHGVWIDNGAARLVLTSYSVR